MTDGVQNYADDLANPDAGWVTRRDAADALGQMANEALTTLRQYAKDDDKDVQYAVEKALGHASAGIRGIEPVAPEKEYGLDELVRAAEKPEKRIVKPKGTGFEVEVHLKEDRTQVVHVEPHMRKDGTRLVSVYTRCGPVEDKTLRWALKNNMNLNHCAFAVMNEDGQEILVLVNNLRTELVVPAEMKAAIKEIAYYGDWIEDKLTGLDTF